MRCIILEAVFPGVYVAYSNSMRTGDYHRRAGSLFAVDLSLKDARHALDLAARSGATMRGVEIAFRDMTLAKEWMGARGDLAGIYGIVREEAGSRFENDA
jgi:3-hydroxyisobutyrate dehydrogenase-like beta-hydroxyacid dehydrogenase